MHDHDIPHKNVKDEILGLMFCEFDNQEGPKILYQVPYEIISKEKFDSISSYVITKPQLKNRIITITIGNHKICGFPIFIEHHKYHRNQYIFNICFLFDQNSNTCSYEAVIKKLACDLRTLEIESEFLSEKKLKSHLPKILEEIHHKLNTTGECVIQKIANLEYSAMFLKLIKNHTDPSPVQNYDVPVFLVNYKSFEIDDWDLTTQKIVRAINGFKAVSLIANETNIEISVVRESIQNLIYSNVVMLVPIIQYSSMFVKTPLLTEFYTDSSIQSSSIRFVQLEIEDKEPPIFYDVFYLFNQFNHGITVKEITDLFAPHEKNIDIKKLILFGLIKGYLRKVNKYPVNPNELERKWQNGQANLDKICSSNGKSVKKIEQELDDDQEILIFIK